jgi:mannitol/fructose-specific phosphotransferase system IIA component (Ntr-type)
MVTNKLNPAAIDPSTLALLLTNAGQRLVTEEQVRIIAEAGDLLSENDTINIVQYTACILAREAGGRE